MLFGDDFPFDIKKRGEDLFREGLVHIVSEQRDQIQFQIFGESKFYSTFKDPNNQGEIEAHCTCEHFGRGFLCTHLWASVLELNKTSFGAHIENKYLDPEIKSVKSPRDIKIPFSIKDFLKDAKNSSNVTKVLNKKTSKADRVFKKSIFVLNLDDKETEDKYEISTYFQTRLKTGDWSKEKNLIFYKNSLEEDFYEIGNPREKRLLDKMKFYHDKSNHFSFYPDELTPLMKDLINSGSFYIKSEGKRLNIKIDTTRSCHLHFKVDDNQENSGWDLKIFIKIDDRLIPFEMDHLSPLLELNYFSYNEIFYPIEIFGLYPLIKNNFSHGNSIEINQRDRHFLTEFLQKCLPKGAYDISGTNEFFEKTEKPRAILKIRTIQYKNELQTLAELEFHYDHGDDLFESIDLSFETNIKKSILETNGIELFHENFKDNEYILNSGKFHNIISHLISIGIEVYADKKRVISHSKSDLKIEPTGTDWFEVKAKVFYEKQSVSLPNILKGKYTNGLIPIGDDQFGLLPLEWLESQKALRKISKIENENIQIHSSFALMIDTLFKKNEIETNDFFKNFITHIKDFKGANQIIESDQFHGTLRQYQREGLSWMQMLKDIRLGGCLADDMGLGKTIQILAEIERHKSQNETNLIVAPKSLVFNWKNEAQKFVPHLKVAIYEGSPLERATLLKDRSIDLLIVSYGLLRREILEFKKEKFQHLILDEAQAIKNSKSQTMKACCLLKAKYRLALTGTPVENSLTDLLSIFEFLNPGHFTTADVFDDRKSNKKILNSLRPFILRRTKEKVLTELPEKTESTLLIDLKGQHKEAYEEIKNFYQKALNKKILNDGLKKNKIHVLDALLRLRQAANHPAIINEYEYEGQSSKINILLEKIKDVQKDGRKIIVFSQFVSLLKQMKNTLIENEIGFEYLDGSTQNRELVVNRFKTSKEKNIFLISIKAGGVGLNLTEADYCFILDPWWNPAVEAQAIDRIHRIGQTKKVFSYKIIAKDTVEEKIVKLQQQKKGLADDLLSSDGEFIKNLSREDLDYLLT
ncbi:SNF2-related protein [Halobacteriovorax sp. GB3]|uniref:SNF2-related protein n=1 Tax=Halobacteriovorax sp. GB3 TaxID=2719615 RepID=UPI00235F937E|nr:DEAD/DEAH box helicase [Halobacteriovorax sp. GB3]MDD0852495.1 SNF2-related protein [Halobacteriovorax sp. GB3]